MNQWITLAGNIAGSIVIGAIASVAAYSQGGSEHVLIAVGLAAALANIAKDYGLIGNEASILAKFKGSAS